MLFRLVFLVVMIFGGLVHWFWKASLISYLAVEEKVHPFRYLEELMSSSYQITTYKDSAYYSYWKNKSEEFGANLFKDVKKSLKDTEDEIFNEVVTGRYTTFLPDLTIKRHPFYKSGQIEPTYSYSKLSIGFAFPKKSKLRLMFDEALKRMTENGELERIKAKHRWKDPEIKTKSKALELRKLCMPFLILIVGLATSLFSLAIEKILAKS